MVMFDWMMLSRLMLIVGVTCRQGKEFFRLTSSLTEDIHHMAVEETRICTGPPLDYAAPSQWGNQQAKCG
jgi:hypothetical protein